MTAAPGDCSALIAAGNALEDRGELDQARARYLEAIAASPESPRPWLNLGNVLARQHRHAEAIDAVRTAIALAPTFGPSHFNLGRLLERSDGAGAEEAYRAAIRHDPQFTNARICLANVLERSGRGGEAESALQDAVAADARHAGALYSLGQFLLERERFDEAESLMRRCLASAPDFALAWGGLGSVCMRTGRLREAEACHRRQMQLTPGSAEAAAGLLFAMLARSDLDPQQVFDVHREVGAALEGPSPQPSSLAPRKPHERLRIGYLSPDFRRHAVALFVQPVLSHHDRSQFEVYCYYAHWSEDAVTRKLKSLADHWRNVSGLDDEAAAKVIRDDEIDVLVDLAGHTGHSRLSLLSRRCAPVQATWLGYLHSTGMTSVDYRICDSHTDPIGTTEHLNTEELVRMPHSQWCYEPMHGVDGIRSVAAARPEGVEFGSFNQFWKISERCLELWIAILERTPGARLRVVGVPQGRTTADFLARLQARGLSGDRVVISARVDIERYFAQIASADIALDTTPYNGATTTLDALWMGVPLVALAGDRAVARGAASILRTLGVPELVANSDAEYVDINVRLAGDAAWRSDLRATLREKLAGSPLMDSARFTRDLEAHFRDLRARA